MRLSVIALVIFAASGCSTTQQQTPVKNTNVSLVTQQEVKPSGNESYSISSIISNQALVSYKTKYREATNYKAFAQSAAGVWNWRSNRTSKQHAIDSALIACQANNEKYEAKHPCQVINVDGDWITQ